MPGPSLRGRSLGCISRRSDKCPAVLQLTAQPTILNENSRLEILPTGKKAIEWYGKLDRTYFIQVSASDKPLAKWKWAPLIESGNNEYISHQVVGTAEKGFFRLQYTDQPIPNGQTIDSADFDSDGLSNLQEITPAIIGYHSIQTNPLDPDTDHDGLTDKWERDHGLNPTDDGSLDPNNGPNGDLDGDGISNIQEQIAGTKPNNSDTDGDGVSDSDELFHNFTNPLTATDADDDGIADDFEKFFARQLLALDPEAAYWGIYYAGLV